MTIKNKEDHSLHKNMETYMNPHNKPVEEVRIKYTSNENAYEEFISGLDERWCKKEHMFTMYTSPPNKNIDGEFAMGSKEDWLERLSLFVDDMNLLLQMPYHRFWSEVLFNSHSLDGISSFLQNAPPFYLRDQLPEDKDIFKALRKAQKLVFLVLVRLTRTKESEVAWIKRSTLGKILYDNFIISLPQLMEISQIYANDNFKEVSDLINRVLEIQPKYMSDIKKSSNFISEVFSNFEQQLELRHDASGGTVGKLVCLMLDISYSLATFVEVCPQAAAVYHEQLLEPRIANFYENTIPVLNKYLDAQYGSGDSKGKHQLKLNVSRHNLIITVHSCLTSYLSTIIQERDYLTNEELKIRTDMYLNTLTDCLSDHVFICDYNVAFPIHKELSTLTEICPEIDSVKCDFILESVSTLYDLPRRRKKDSASSLGEASSTLRNHTNSAQSSSHERKSDGVKKKVTGVELQSYITEVKDLLPHLGDGFIAKCLEHYNYKSADVINALLEENLPESLILIDRDLPIIPPEESEENNGMPERVNVFDNDEFDIMTNDQVDTSRIHKGKRPEKHKNFSELLDDKSHVKELREVYTQLSIVEDIVDVNQYEDEYDDTYDDLDVPVGNEGETEAEERRAFVIPRVLQQYKKVEEPQDYYDEQEDERAENGNNVGRDLFIENPEEVRARMEQRRQEQRDRGGRSGGNPAHRDVVGKPKGQGQEKEVVKSRDHKNSNKASRGNHNRRVMAAKKRRQGMLPS